MYFIPTPTKTSLVPNFSSFAGVSGYKLTQLTTSTLALSAGYARAFSNNFVLEYASFVTNLPNRIVLNISTVGAGGCFPTAISNLTLASNTVYGIYVIANSLGTTGGSLNSSVEVSAVIATGNDFLPPGYDSYRRVGLVYISSATKLIIPMAQSGNGTDRVYTLQDGVAAVSAGHGAVPTAVDLSINNGVVMPGKQSSVNFGLNLTATVANQFMWVEPFGLTATSVAPTLIQSPAVGVIADNVEMAVGLNALGNASINYLLSNAAATANIVVQGFTDNLGPELF